MVKNYPRLFAALLCLALSACGGSQPDSIAALSAATFASDSVASQTGSSSAKGSDTSSHPAASTEKPDKDHDKGLSQARFNGPVGIAFDAAGNLYVADSLNFTIRKISTDGAVTTIAGTPGERGSADGFGAAARFSALRGLAVDQWENIYVTDGNVVRKITQAGQVTTIAGVQGAFGNIDGPGSTARFSFPNGIAVDADGNVYVADFFDLVIRKISPNDIVSTLAGGNSTGSTFVAFDGVGTAARFIGPNGLTIDKAGNLYVTDTGDGPNVSILVSGSTLIRKVDRITGAVVTVAGNLGLANTPMIPTTTPVAEFEEAFGIAVDESGNIFVADHLNGGNRIRKVTPSGEISTVAENFAQFGALAGLAIDRKGNLFASDSIKDVIVKITQSGGGEVVAGKLGEAGSIDVSACAGDERLFTD